MAALIPEPIQPLLAEYRARLERDTFALVAGSYLHGSIALGAFDPARSDIDFMTVLHRPCTPAELAFLAVLHRDLARRFPRWRMGGTYLSRSHLPATGAGGQVVIPSPQDAASFDGRFHPYAPHDMNPVTWWILQNHGMPLLALEPAGLGITIGWETVRAYVEDNLDTYWRAWAYRPKRMAALLTGWGIEWAVLGILRLQYALNENRMISKVGAGEYGLQVMAQKWHRLLREALRIRRREPGAHFPSRVLRATEAVRFLRDRVERAGC